MIGKYILPKTYPKPFAMRLNGWARYDPDGEDPNNPLNSDKAVGYWERHNSKCLTSSNPHNRQSSPLHPLPFLSSSALIELEKLLTRSKRIRTLTEKSRQWAEESAIMPVKRKKLLENTNSSTTYTS